MGTNKWELLYTDKTHLIVQVCKCSVYTQCYIMGRMLKCVRAHEVCAGKCVLVYVICSLCVRVCVVNDYD